MEIQLQELIEQIKKDGVAAAEAEAKNIIDTAKAEDESIIADAQAQADKILSDAKVKLEHMVKTSDEAIRQAGRNLLISFRESVTRELNAIIRENVDSIYSSKALCDIIIKVIESWAAREDAENISVILNGNDLKTLEEQLLCALNKKMLNGVTLKASDNFDGGFRIAVNNGRIYYDYSSEAVVDMLSAYLSPRIAKLLKEEQ